MNVFRKIWCRIFQKVFYIAIPILPYRKPIVYENVEQLPEALRSHKVGNVLLVTDSFLDSSGIAGRVEDVLKKANINFATYSDTVSNPTVMNVEEALALYKARNCEAVVALGGGSSIDCGKAVAVRVARPHKSIGQLSGIMRVWKKLPLVVAIPTTAGTGSETSVAAVITDDKTHHKYAIMDFPLIPRYAVLDYTFTIGLPRAVTAFTGLDALVHAVEAYIGHSSTRETRAWSEKAITLISNNLYAAYLDGSNAEARKNMLQAAFFAGLAFSKSYVGYVHAVAHSLGGKYGTPHGLANAIMLPIVLRAYGAAAEAPLSRLALLLNLANATDTQHEAATKFIDWTQELNDKMGIPRTLDTIREEDIDEMASYADDEGNPLYPVPVLWDKNELKKLYRLAMPKNNE